MLFKAHPLHIKIQCIFGAQNKCYELSSSVPLIFIYVILPISCGEISSLFDMKFNKFICTTLTYLSTEPLHTFSSEAVKAIFPAAILYGFFFSHISTSENLPYLYGAKNSTVNFGNKSLEGLSNWMQIWPLWARQITEKSNVKLNGTHELENKGRLSP